MKIVYAILILFVIGYSSFIGGRILGYNEGMDKGSEIAQNVWKGNWEEHMCSEHKNELRPEFCEEVENRIQMRGQKFNED